MKKKKEVEKQLDNIEDAIKEIRATLKLEDNDAAESTQDDSVPEDPNDPHP